MIFVKLTVYESSYLLWFYQILCIHYMGHAKPKGVLGQSWSMKAHISLCICAILWGHLLSTYRIIHFRSMYHWTAKSMLRLHSAQEDLKLEYYIYPNGWTCWWGPASVVQLDNRPTGDQEVAGSTPAGSAIFFRGDLIMKYFLQSFSPYCWFKKGSCQFLAKECAKYWLTA